MDDIEWKCALHYFDIDRVSQRDGLENGKMTCLEDNIAIFVTQSQEVSWISIVCESCNVDVAWVDVVLVVIDVIAVAA